MRTIKFREFNIMTKKMSFPDSIRLPWEQKRDGIYLMQYTELKDKNGKEIYEGDVVRHIETPNGHDLRDENYIYQMVWNDSGFSLQGLKSDIPTSFILDKKWGGLCEIIGNIYENPELLK